MPQVFAHFEHIKVVRKVVPTKNFDQDYNIAQFFLTEQLFIWYGAPDVPVSMVAAYHRVDGERSVHHESKSSN